MSARKVTTVGFKGLIVLGLTAFTACGSSGSKSPPANGEIPIVAAAGADVPYQLGTNSYGVVGGAFLAKANLGSSTVVLDTSAVGKICLSGTVEMVPTPADGSHPPYSDYW